MNSVNGVTCIKGEIHSLLTLMRLHQSTSNEPLKQAFRRLAEQLQGKYFLSEINCVEYLEPFAEVIVSKYGNGILTSAALSALSKFTMYGFLSVDMPGIDKGMNIIASCISNCVFEESDRDSDEVILMKLLELSTLLFRVEASSFLTVAASWAIYNTCLLLHSQYKVSKIMKSEAETSLRHLTLIIYSRVHSIIHDKNLSISSDCITALNTYIPDSATFDAANTTTIGTVEGIVLLISKIMFTLTNLMDSHINNIATIQFSLSLINICLESGGTVLSTMKPLVTILRVDLCRHLLRISQSEDIEIFSLTLRVVYNLFMSIKDHMKIQLEVFLTSVHLRILKSSSVVSTAKEEMALESLLEFCREPSLMHDLYVNYDCDVQCTNLFDLIVTTLCKKAFPSGGFPSNISSASSGSSVLSTANVDPCKSLLAYQGILAVLHSSAKRCRIPPVQHSANSILIPENNYRGNDSGDGSSKCVSDVEDLETQVDNWCNTSEEAQIAVPVTPSKSYPSPFTSPMNSPSASPMVSPTGSLRISVSAPGYLNRHENSLDANSTDEQQSSDVASSRMIAAEILRARRVKKQQLKHVAEKFNEKPLKQEWLNYAIELGLIQQVPASSPPLSSSNVSDSVDILAPPLSVSTTSPKSRPKIDPKAVAKFIRNTPGLGKIQIGEYLSKGPKELYPFHAEVLREYVDTFSFKGRSFDEALRIFLGSFHLPGESQCIDRLMEAFSLRLYADLGKGNPFLTSDATFILAFSTIMLNTDLHNPQIPSHKRMKKEEFIHNNRGINDNGDLPIEYLSALYDGIKNKQIQLDADILNPGELNMDITELTAWNLLISKSQNQTPALFTSTTAARLSGRNGHFPPYIHEKDMFIVMSEHVLSALCTALSTPHDAQLLGRTLLGIYDYYKITCHLHLHALVNKLFMKLISMCLSILVLQENVVLISTLLTTDEVSTRMKYFESLLNVPIDELLLQHKHLSEDMKFRQFQLIKGEILVKLILHMFTQSYNSLDSPSIVELIHLLLFLRCRGVLPSALVQLQGVNSTRTNEHDRIARQFRSASTTTIAHSIFCHQCFAKARGNATDLSASTDMTSSTSNGNSGGLWGTVTNLLGIKGSKEHAVKSGCDGNVVYADVEASIHGFKYRRTLYECCFTCVSIEQVLFSNHCSSSACGLDSTELTPTLQGELSGSTLAYCIALVTGIVQSIELLLNFPDNSSVSGDNSSPYAELEAVLLLQWLENVFDSNIDHIHQIWTTFHGLLIKVFTVHATYLSITMPFFLERCIQIVLLMPSLHPDDTTAVNTRTAAGNTFDNSIVWESVRLLKSIPVTIVEQTSVSIAQSLSVLIKYASSQRTLVTLPDYNSLFIIASTLCMEYHRTESVDITRRILWDCIAYLVQSSVHVNNFTSCRLLVLRYLHGIFVPDNGSDFDMTPTLQSRFRIYQNDAVFALLKLTYMALAGLILCNKSQPQSGQNDEVNSVIFNLPTQNNELLSFPHYAANSSVAVKPVVFPNSSDVSVLWLETCKTYGDLCKEADTSIFKKTLPSLQAVLSAATACSFSGSVWYSCLSDLHHRLPIALHESVIKSLSPSDRAIFIDACIRCCHIIFEIWAERFQLLILVENMSTIWFEFMKILAINISISPRISLIHDEMLEMIGSLLCLLQAASVSNVSLTKLLLVSWGSIVGECKFLSSDLKSIHPKLVSDLVLMSKEQGSTVEGSLN